MESLVDEINPIEVETEIDAPDEVETALPTNEVRAFTTGDEELAITTQDKNESRDYSCDKCEYGTTQRDHLKIHIETSHEEVVYSCDQCDLKTKLMEHLKTHIESIHGSSN